MYIWDFSRSVGAGKATTRNTRGLTRSTIRLIVPPLPAVSRPSKTMHTLAPVALTHSCMATSSACSLRISASYSLRGSFAPVSGSAEPSGRECAPAALPSVLFAFFFPTATSGGCASEPSGSGSRVDGSRGRRRTADAHEPDSDPGRPGVHPPVRMIRSPPPRSGSAHRPAAGVAVVAEVDLLGLVSAPAADDVLLTVVVATVLPAVDPDAAPQRLGGHASTVRPRGHAVHSLDGLTRPQSEPG